MARKKRPVTIPPLIFNVYKPVGPTCSDIVQHFKKHLPDGFGKIGHLGTLDPFAEGVLLIAVAGAARVNDYFHQGSPKHYRAVGIFGHQTDTGDLDGQIIAEKPVPSHWEAQDLREVESVLRQKFCGTYWQKVPQYSATKHCGRPLYEYARAGEVIEKPKVERRIYDLRIVGRRDQELEIEAVVGTGTYIRSLFEDICEFLGSCGHLKKLVRTRIGALDEKDSLKSKDWPLNKEAFDPLERGYTLDKAFPLSCLELDADESLRYRHGQTVRIGPSQERLRVPELQESLDLSGVGQNYWVFDDEKRICGLGELKGVELNVAFNLPKFLA